MIKDGAVVVLYNPEESDYKNIAGYADEVGTTYIIDNSPNNNLKNVQNVLKVDNEHIIYEHHPENLGLCKGMNIGLLNLYRRGCAWALTMNSDSSFEKGAIKVFQDYVQKHDCSKTAILAPVYTFDRNVRQKYFGTKRLKRAMMSGNYLNLEIFMHLGGFYEALFVDGLDNDYCIRLGKAHYSIIECGQALMHHMPCKTGKRKIFNKTYKYGYDSPKRYHGHARALTYIWHTYHSPYEFFFYIYKFLKIIFLFDNKKQYISEYKAGTKEGLKIPKMTSKDFLKH